jgi:hypothetical protein
VTILVSCFWRITVAKTAQDDAQTPLPTGKSFGSAVVQRKACEKTLTDDYFPGGVERGFSSRRSEGEEVLVLVFT